MLFKTSVVLFETYFALDNVAHSIFSTKYLSIAIHLDRLFNNKTDTQYVLLAVFCAQILLIFATTTFLTWALLNDFEDNSVVRLA